MKHKPNIFLLTVIVALCWTMPAMAIVEPSVRDAYDGGCVVNMSSSACFGYDAPLGTTYQGPVVQFCYATAASNTRCRLCMDAYYDDGQPRNYKVCAYVAFEAACECKKPNTPNCRSDGTCSYHR